MGRMSRSSTRIAIVDDDAAVRTALTRLLQTSYEAQAFASASEFLASLYHRSPDCLILDLQMPEMNGLELQVYLARAGIKIPTIIVTAHDESSSRAQCTAAGAVAYLVKPLRKATLVKAIDAATETSV